MYCRVKYILPDVQTIREYKNEGLKEPRIPDLGFTEQRKRGRLIVSLVLI